MRLKWVDVRLRTGASSAGLLRSSTATNVLAVAIWCPSGILSQKCGPPFSKFRYTGGGHRELTLREAALLSLPD